MLILVGCTTVNELTSRVSEAISPSSAVLSSDGLVIDSLKTLNILKNREDRRVFLTALQNAAGVAIFPAVYKAGFFVGAEGGNGLVIARDTHGNWGYPAFYTLAGGSWGIQFGGQRAGVVLILRSRKAVEAVLKHQGKAGADFGIAFGADFGAEFSVDFGATLPMASRLFFSNVGGSGGRRPPSRTWWGLRSEDPPGQLGRSGRVKPA